jgi:hypothetical protein
LPSIPFWQVGFNLDGVGLFRQALTDLDKMTCLGCSDIQCLTLRRKISTMFSVREQ